MKKYRKKELLGMVTSLEKINNAIARNYNSNIPVTVEVLAQCQESAIAIGNAVETIEGPAGDIIGMLEDYCENLYQMSLVINDDIKRRKRAKKIQKGLAALKNRMKYDLPKDRKEIVFLPYKASMWDSLESIWKEASEDKNCDTYVIPVPYFDKNKDGTFGQMHCEKDAYPAGVPVTDWQEYDISERRPDVIYIHNPYDEFNYVTSVHPAFYARELKKYTDMLVYVPYFVAIGERLQAHFCILPGTLYADRVIVQSEAVRQTYIAQYREFERESRHQDSFAGLEEKFMALGSPKYDKVFAAKEEAYPVPKAWERLIFRPDGSRKKVILYNITVDTVLKQDKRTLGKIKEVLKLFRAEKDAVLLWRPHPLLATIIESMRPQLAAKYNEIIDWYKREGFGIFDDSPDVHRAIAISDAYFGDMSSVVELYKPTGKAVLIESFLPEGTKGLMFEGYVQIDETTAYGSCALFNGLFKIDVKTDRCTYVGMFPGERASGKRMHARAVYADRKIYFAPASAEYISVYDVQAGAFESVSIRDYRGAYRYYKTQLKFADAVRYEDAVFFISATYPAVIRMRLGTKEMDYYTDWVPEDGFVFRQGTLVKGAVFYIPNSADNTVLKFHMDSGKGELLHIGVNNHGSWSICEAENDFWLIPRNKGAFIRWNISDNTITEYDDYPEGFEDRKFLFTKGYWCGGFLRAIPAYANMSVKVSPATGEITESELIKVEKDEAVGFLFESAPYYYLFRQKKKENTSFTEYTGYYRLNVLDNTLQECCFEFCGGRAEYTADYYRQMGLERENAFFDLKDFLKNVTAEKEGDRNPKDAICRSGEMPAGKRIHEKISAITEGLQ